MIDILDTRGGIDHARQLANDYISNALDLIEDTQSVTVQRSDGTMGRVRHRTRQISPPTPSSYTSQNKHHLVPATPGEFHAQRFHHDPSQGSNQTQQSYSADERSQSWSVLSVSASQSILNDLFGLSINVTRRFIQNQNTGISQQCTRK